MECAAVSGRTDLLNEIDRLRSEFRRTGKALVDKIAFMQALIDAIPCPVFYKGVDGVYLGCNKAFEAYIGRPREEIVGITVFDIAPKTLADVYHKADMAMFQSPGEQRYEASVRYADGTCRDVFFSKATYRDGDGRLAGLIGVMIDITERKAAELALKEKELRLREVIQSFPLPTFVIGKDHVVLDWNRAMEEFSGVSADEMIGTCNHWKAFYTEKRPCMADFLIEGEIEASNRFYANNVVQSALQNEAYEVTEYLPHRGKNGVWMKDMAAILRDTDDNVVGAIETVEDISDRKRAEAVLVVHKEKLEELVAERTRELSSINAALLQEIAERKRAEEALASAREELEHQVAQRTQELRQLNEALISLSFQDGLTGISNRRYLDEFLEREWQRAKREKTALAVIMADVDYFKAYNDTYGHVAGDACLKAVAGVLKATPKRAVDFVARYGGEEFIIVLPGTDLEGANALAEKMRAGVEVLRIEHRTSAVASGAAGTVPSLTVSLGVASMIPQDAVPASRLVAAADAGLYQAKSDGRNRVAAVELGLHQLLCRQE